MHLKKLSLVVLLAVSQTAAAVPVFAEAGNITSSNTSGVRVATTSVAEVIPEATDPLPSLKRPVAEGATATPTPTATVTPITGEQPILL